MKWNVLITAHYLQSEIDIYRQIFIDNDINIDLIKANEKMTEDELLNIIHKYDGVICGDDQFTPKVLDKAKKLKVISKWGTGIDSIDKDYATKKQIKVYNTPNAFSNPVADTAMAWILSFARNVIDLNKNMKNGQWEKIKGKSLDECTLGVIGVGNCGKAVIKRASAFGMKILGNDINEVDNQFLKKYNVNMTDFENLLKYSDFISLNCDLNSTSHHIITMKELKKMKSTTVLINTARGPLIKQEDLIKALQDKIIAGCGLDVFENEPLSKDSNLLNMDNCILAPHNANSSSYYWNYVHQNTINNLLKELK